MVIQTSLPSSNNDSLSLSPPPANMAPISFNDLTFLPDHPEIEKSAPEISKKGSSISFVVSSTSHLARAQLTFHLSFDFVPSPASTRSVLTFDLRWFSADECYQRLVENSHRAQILWACSRRGSELGGPQERRVVRWRLSSWRLEGRGELQKLRSRQGGKLEKS